MWAGTGRTSVVVADPLPAAPTSLTHCTVLCCDIPRSRSEEEPHFALTALCRSQFMLAIRKRSCEIMMQAFTIATRCKIPLDTVLDAQGTPVAVGGSIASLAPLLFTPGHLHPVEIETPFDASEIPHDICAAIGRTQSTITDGWVLVRVYSRGRVRFFTSPAFERDIVTWDVFKENNKRDDPGRPSIELIIPPAECPKVLHMIGMQVGTRMAELFASLASPCSLSHSLTHALSRSPTVHRAAPTIRNNAVTATDSSASNKSELPGWFCA